MIIIKIIGGLGNQMFQYAYAKALQKKGHNVKIDISVFETYKLHGGYQLDKYTIDLDVSIKDDNYKFYSDSFLSKVLKKLRIDFSKKIKEKTLLFDEKLLKIKDNSYIDGYFQSEMYFHDIRELIINQFKINIDVSNYTKIIEKEILVNDSNCSIHIRRGDYVSDKNVNVVHGTCDLEYYQKAMSIMNDKYKGIRYFIFSDDISWVKENLQIKNAVYIESKEKRIPHEDIYLMSLCDHNIIANSSFSWWGAWLNKNSDKIVIAPKRWFSDEKMYEQSKNIVCDGWIKI